MVSKTISWLFNASQDNTSIKDWVVGLVLILILAFLWSTVIKSMEDV